MLESLPLRSINFSSLDLAWFFAHVPLYWLVCGVCHLAGWGRLSPEQEKKNRVSRWAVAARVVEIQISQLLSYVAIRQLELMPVSEQLLDWRFLRLGALLVCLVLFDLVEYVMHRIYHHRLLYKHVHKAHHLLWCPYPHAALYNSRIEATLTGAMLFLVFRTAGFSLAELVVINLLGTLKTIRDHTWVGNKDGHHWVHHEVNINSNYEQPWTDVFDRLLGTKHVPKKA